MSELVELDPVVEPSPRTVPPTKTLTGEDRWAEDNHKSTSANVRNGSKTDISRSTPRSKKTAFNVGFRLPACPSRESLPVPGSLQPSINPLPTVATRRHTVGLTIPVSLARVTAKFAKFGAIFRGNRGHRWSAPKPSPLTTRAHR